MEVTRSALLAVPPERLYALVEQAEHYPSFLPWCTEASVLERRAHFVRARVGFGFRGLESHLLADVDKQPFHTMDVRVAGWPFDGFRGRWRFEPLGEAGCRVTFSARTDFRDAWWGAILRFAAGLIADRLVAAFVARALATAVAAPRDVGDAG
ncbi:MAG: type II toxin-antitoxin system RatA family toxin [Pseudomonadota bacterium]|jgi:ribosome-associated toxin RatA of RatAB toxin-antitoxin module